MIVLSSVKDNPLAFTVHDDHPTLPLLLLVPVPLDLAVITGKPLLKPELTVFLFTIYTISLSILMTYSVTLKLFIQNVI